MRSPATDAHPNAAGHRSGEAAGGRLTNSTRRVRRKRRPPWLEDRLEMLLEDRVRHLADLNEVHLSEPIDEDRHRQPHVYTIRRSDLAGGVVDGRKFDVDFAKKGLHRAGARLLVVHGQHDQALALIDVAGTLNQRHLVLAGPAPGGPEVKDNRLAAVLA